MDSFFFRKHIGDEKRWCEELNGNLYISHGKANSCGVATGYAGSKYFSLANQTADKNGRLLLIEAVVDDVKFVFINIYNCNTEPQQLLALTEYTKYFKTSKILEIKKYIY